MKKIRVIIGLAALAISAVSYAMHVDAPELNGMLKKAHSPTQKELSQAITRCDVQKVKSMLEGKVNPNDFIVADFAILIDTPLMYAVRLGSFPSADTEQRRPQCREIIELLLKHGADVNQQLPFTKSDYVLYKLIGYLDAEWIEFFLNQGADPSISYDFYNENDDSYEKARTMQLQNCPGPLAVLEKYKEKIKAKVVEAVPVLPGGVAGIVAGYL